MLASLEDLRLPDGVECEALIADNNSTDDTRNVVSDAIEKLHGRLPARYLFESRQGKSFALNRMVAESEGDWLLFLDDDVQVTAGWLEAYLAGMQRHPGAGAFGGPIAPWLDAPVTGRLAFLLREFGTQYGILEIERDTPMSPPAISAWGANLVVRRDLLPAEGFATDRGMLGGRRVAGEDVAICQHVVDTGHEAWLLADATVRHWVPRDRLTTRHYCRWQAGLGRMWVLQRGRPTPGRFGVPWWAWKTFLKRAAGAAVRWRPWPTRPFYDALGAAAQYYGYLRSD